MILRLYILLFQLFLVFTFCKASVPQNSLNGFCIPRHDTTKIKPVRGTWLNLVYQDERNKYTNPLHVDATSAVFWETKIAEYAHLGMEYLIIMAVANEGASYYPSDFMKPAYNTGNKSPVEAIMNAAEKNGMKVFLSCGWAVNQDDDLRKPEMRELQRKIMDEIADKFKNRKSFYGWYLPVEDAVSPILSEHAVDAVNALTQKARSVTPNAKILVSPYGIWNADIDNPSFAAQIKKLKVDIIAYQDEVGCAREAMPLPRLKENLKKLRKIHDETSIQFWVNVESFTWEKNLNSRGSALIPAAFPRYLSQIVAANKAGADEIVSFIFQGIVDKPESFMFIGQPGNAQKNYVDYSDWLKGANRWPLLQQSFANSNISHAAIGSKIKCLLKPSTKSKAEKLTDGQLAEEFLNDERWVRFNKSMEAVIDLKNNQLINTIAARFMHYKPAQIFLPSVVTFYTSVDGKVYNKLQSVVMEKTTNDLHDCWIDIAELKSINKKVRFIKVVADNTNNGSLFCDEIIVNPL